MVQNDTITEEADQQRSDDDVWTQGPDGELIPDYDSTFPIINEGEVVRGKVVRVDKDEVLISATSPKGSSPSRSCPFAGRSTRPTRCSSVTRSTRSS
jgi:hypothetical protein